MLKMKAKTNLRKILGYVFSDIIIFKNQIFLQIKFPTKLDYLSLDLTRITLFANLFEQIMKENFPNLAREIDFQEVQEAQRVPKKLDPRRNTLRHMIVTLPKIKRKDLHPRLLYPAKLSFIMEGKIKCFSDKVKLKEFIITKPLLYEMLKGLI